MQLATHDDAPFSEAHFLAYLAEQIPTCTSDGRGDVLGADVALGKAFLVNHRAVLFGYESVKITLFYKPEFITDFTHNR